MTDDRTTQSRTYVNMSIIKCICRLRVWAMSLINRYLFGLFQQNIDVFQTNELKYSEFLCSLQWQCWEESRAIYSNFLKQPILDLTQKCKRMLLIFSRWPWIFFGWNDYCRYWSLTDWALCCKLMMTANFSIIVRWYKKRELYLLFKLHFRPVFQSMQISGSSQPRHAYTQSR